MARVVDRFVREARREGSIAHHRQHVERLALQVAGGRDPECRGHGGAGVAGAENVMHAFAATQEG